MKVSAIFMIFAATTAQALLYDAHRLQCSARDCSWLLVCMQYRQCMLMHAMQQQCGIHDFQSTIMHSRTSSGLKQLLLALLVQYADYVTV